MSKAGAQKKQQLRLQFILGSEIRMASFTGEDMVLGAVPKEPRFSQSRARSDDCLVADSSPAHFVQGNEIFGLKGAHAPCAGLQIVDQQRGRDLKLFREARLLDDPGKIGGLNPAVAHRAGDAEAGYIGAGARIIQKFGDNFAKFGMLAAGKYALTDEAEMAILGLKIGQPRVGAAYIAGQNHLSKFLQRRPSRSSSSSASFGPQEPEG